MQDIPGRTASNSLSVINSGGYRWTISQVTGTGQADTDGVSMVNGSNNIVITADHQNAAGAASGTNGAGVAAIASYSGGNAAMTALSQAVNNLTSAAEIEKAGAQLRPSANGATAQAALGAVGQAVNTISVRTDSVRSASAETGGGTGVSSGEMLRGLGVWTQAFGSVATQDRRLGIDGYTADTYGLAFGADAKVAEPLRLGLSFAYARTGVDDAGAREGSGQTINSYIGSLYGTYTAPRWYLDGAVTYGHHSYDGTRVINIAGAARQTAKSSYGGNQYGAKAELGVPFAVGAGVTLTPLAGLAYNHLRQDGYTEKDAAAALTVGSSNTDSIKSSLGAKASATIAQWREWNVRPNARAVWSHEFNTKAHDQTSAYVDGGSSFTNTGTDAASESFTLGLGVDLASVRNTTLSAKYDAGLSDRYVSHTGSLQARMEF
ncbi:autotransporter outer membrane beta-barrel domain-containing protein [Magnetospirillum sp. 15-1]|uniref:autotransporter outer membrane beta-barrel domain-containing protein n=1 Tax=Magnetospirillum sp. 15-1 TaxID=1979370 RepID=UPI000BBC313D|nr:autotransporter outer membrane beta-barrel domain-containing protein [Magnetospirillum sp. 15-1]